MPLNKVFLRPRNWSLIGVSQKGSRERCLPVFFAENETEQNGQKKEENGKNGT